jgi:hypothetical protein
VVNITDLFRAEFQHRAHLRNFQDLELSRTPLEPDVPEDDFYQVTTSTSMMGNLQELLRNAKVYDITQKENEEPGDLIDLSHDLPLPQEDVSAWIEDLYEQGDHQSPPLYGFCDRFRVFEGARF